ncbi:hypothetical protein HDU76_006974, partial [Blyttiomyces sp. JEL0837]
MNFLSKGWKHTTVTEKLEGPDSLEREFLRFLDDFNFQGEARENMLRMDAEKRRLLVQQWRGQKGVPKVSLPSSQQASQTNLSRSTSSSSASMAPSQSQSYNAMPIQPALSPRNASLSSMPPLDRRSSSGQNISNANTYSATPSNNQPPTSPSQQYNPLPPAQSPYPPPQHYYIPGSAQYQPQQPHYQQPYPQPYQQQYPQQYQQQYPPPNYLDPYQPVVTGAEAPSIYDHQYYQGSGAGAGAGTPVAPPRSPNTQGGGMPAMPYTGAPGAVAGRPLSVSNKTGTFSNISNAFSEGVHELKSAFENVLDSLHITGAYRDDVLKRTTDAQKQAIVTQYHRKAQGGTIKRVPSLSVIDTLDGVDLDRELESALSDPDVNITGVARANLMRHMSTTNKRILLKQYFAKKKRTPQIRPLPPVPDESASLAVGVAAQEQPGGETTWQREPSYFVRHFADRNTNMKTLFRLLTNFRIKLSLATPEGIQAFIETTAVVGSQHVKGVQSLEIALHRVNQINAQASVRPSNNNTVSSTNGGSNGGSSGAAGYSDVVFDDELRLEAVTCISIIMNNNVGMDAVLGTPGIINQMASCLLCTPAGLGYGLASDARLRSSNLMMRVKVAEILGPLCLISDKGLRLVLQAMSDSAVTQSEPARFHNLVASLVNPFVDPSQVDFRATSDPAIELLDDSELIWTFRASILVFIVGIVSAPEDTDERVKLRSEVESRGLRLAFAALGEWDPIPIVIEHMDLYEEDRQEDLEEIEEIEPHEAINALLEASRNLPDPERSVNLILRALTNISMIVSSVSNRSTTAAAGNTGTMSSTSGSVTRQDSVVSSGSTSHASRRS